MARIVRFKRSIETWDDNDPHSMRRARSYQVRRASVRLVVVLLLATSLASLVSACSYFAITPTPTAPTSPTPDPSLNAVQLENQKLGSDAWHVDHPITNGHDIEGFTVPASVNIGETVQLYVDTLAQTYTFLVFRMGWYQGHGARLVYTSPTIAGVAQPTPLYDPITRTTSCANWIKPVRIPVGADWTSGYYIIKMVSSTGKMRYAVFVVRDDNRPSTILTQISFLTYQAYNNWGDHSLYDGPDATGAVTADGRSLKVSFDRPYYPNGGLMLFGFSEANMLRWMEKQGYDVSYTTDIDLNHGLLTNHKLLVIPGHDEYWSTAMRLNVTAARDAGVSLAFFSANNMYWHVRMEDSPLGRDRIVVCYRHAALDPITASDPKEATVRWRDAPVSQPEKAVLGQQYVAAVQTATALTLTAAAQPFFTGTNLVAGMSFPDLMDGEYDLIPDNPNNSIYTHQIVLTDSPLTCSGAKCPASGADHSTSVVGTAPSGARVFDAGTFFWAQGLDDLRLTSNVGGVHTDPQFQRLTSNLLSYLITDTLPQV